jgi:hypothetical protein
MSDNSDFSALDFDVSANHIPERRKGDANMEIVKQIFKEVKAVRQDLQEQRGYMSRAFPGDDPDGHRAAHEASIKKTESSARFWNELYSSVVKWGVIGILGFAVIAIWKSFLIGPK